MNIHFGCKFYYFCICYPWGGMSHAAELRFGNLMTEDMANKEINAAMTRMQTYMSAIPNDLENKTEKHYQTIIYLIFSLLGYYIHTEVKSAVGRADAVCVADGAVYVFEFKVDSSAEAALRQIDDRGYMIPFRNEAGKKLVKVGVNISSSTRSLEDWLVEYV